VLVTNDDGFLAPGIAALALAVESAGHEVVVAAPSGECSGAGAALGPLHLTGKIAYAPISLVERTLSAARVPA
jgi:5'-nucleotidase